MKQVNDRTIELSDAEVAIDQFFREQLATREARFATLLGEAAALPGVTDEDIDSVAFIAWLFEHWGEHCLPEPKRRG